MNAVDQLLNQIDDITINEICCSRCSKTEWLYTLSCNHTICLDCIIDLNNNNNTDCCPTCNVVLTKNLKSLYKSFKNDPMAKLSYYHNIKKGDVVWCYAGYNNFWFYSKDKCAYFEEKYADYEAGLNNGLIPFKIQGVDYILDLDNVIQYQLNAKNKRRPINRFVLNSLNDLKTSKIIGIEGKLL